MTIKFHHAANQRFAVHRLAMEYRDAGISIVPLRLDGSKGPALAGLTHTKPLVFQALAPSSVDSSLQFDVSLRHYAYLFVALVGLMRSV